MEITEREFDTILAALRLWQSEPFGSAVCDIREIASEHGEPLNAAEVDELCVKLNCGLGKTPYGLVTISGGVGDLALAEGCDVDILDFDNLKDETPETVFLSDREWAYLKEHDLDEYNRLRVPLQTA